MYDEKKLTRLAHLKSLAERVNKDFARKTDLEALQTSNDKKLEGVKVNGQALAIAEKMVDILIASGTANGTIKVNNVDVAVKGLAALAYKSEIAESDLSAALKKVLDGKAAKATTLDGYGITDAYTKEQLDAKISAVYKPAGTVAFNSLPAATVDILGNVYNVSDDFTTDAKFVEGAGKKYPAGTNVVVISTGDSAYKYDVLSGVFDLTPYAKTADVNKELAKKVNTEEGKGLSTNDYTTPEKEKLAGIEAGANLYNHPKHTAAESGLYKVTVDGEGHVSATTPVAKEDITGLGIPAQDTTYTPATTSQSGLMSAEDKTKLDGMVYATPEEVTAVLDEVFAPAI